MLNLLNQPFSSDIELDRTQKAIELQPNEINKFQWNRKKRRRRKETGARKQ